MRKIKKKRKTNRKLEITDPRVRRFPRLIEGDDASTIAKLSWQNPEVTIRITDDRSNVEFKYLIPVPKELQSISIYDNFFGPGNTLLEESLRTTYQDEKSGGKTVHYMICNRLRQVYDQAFCNYVEGAWEKRVEDPAIIAAQVSRYDHALGKRSQPNPWIALEIVNEIDRIIPAIRTLRYELEKIPPAFRERYPIPPPLVPDLLKNALIGIFPIKKSKPLSVFENANDAKIAEAYVKCLIREKYPRLKFEEAEPTDEETPKRKPTGRPTFKSYRRTGNKIRKVISNLPHERLLLGINPPLDRS